MTESSAGPKMSRVWAMCSRDTFDCEPIGYLVKRFLANSKVSIDPFSRDKRWATFTNDLNPNTKAEYHMDVKDFLESLVARGVRADLVIFDPPYSPEQMKRSYESFGLKMVQTDALRTAGWATEKDLINRLIEKEGFVLSFGWDSCGMGIKRSYRLEELLLVCHGGGRNDTICTVERKVNHQEIFQW